MIIRAVELENIRSYRCERVEFDLGINFLSGDIGCGKSSILLAIEFVLFGFKRGDLEGFQLLRKGEKSGSIKVEFVDSKNVVYEISRSLKKSSTDVISQGNGFVKVNGNVIELSPTEMNAYVFDLFNFPIEFLSRDKNLIYRFTIYTVQEQLKEILFATNDSRLEVIRKIFGIDKYKQLQNGVSIYNPVIRDEKKVLEVKLEEMPKLVEELKVYGEDVLKFKNELIIYENKEKNFNEKLVKFKDAFTSREKKVLEVQGKINELDKVLGFVEKIDNDFIEKKKVLDKIIQNDYEKKIADAKIVVGKKEKELKLVEIEKCKIEQDLKKRKEVQIELDKLRVEKLALDSKVKRLDDMRKSFDYVLTKCKIKDLESFIAKDLLNVKKFEKVEEEFNEKNKRVILLESLINAGEKEALLFDKKIYEIDKMHSCEFCLQEVNDKHKKEIVKNLKSEKKEKEVLLKESLKELKVLVKEVEKISAQKEIAIHANKKVELSQQKLEMLNEQEKRERVLYEDMNKLKKEIDEFNLVEHDLKFEILNKRMSEFEKLVLELEKKVLKEREFRDSISDMNLKISKTENMVAQKEMIEKDLELFAKEREIKLGEFKKKSVLVKKIDTQKIELAKLVEDKNKVNSNIEKLHENLRLVSNRISSFRTEIKSKEELILKGNDKISKVKNDEITLKNLIELESFLNRDVIDVTSRIEKNLFTKYYLEFNEEFERLFRELIEDNEIDVRLDSEFSPVIEQNGYDIDIKNLSGGEKSSLAVAYRLGLKKIIEQSFVGSNQLSLLILDEPTDGFSNEQVVRLGNILRETNSNQIIIVSHDEKVEGIADKVLRVDKINHVSSIISS